MSQETEVLITDSNSINERHSPKLSIINMIAPCFMGLWLFISPKHELSVDTQELISHFRAEIPKLEERIQELKEEEFLERENIKVAILESEMIKFFGHKRRITQINANLKKYSDLVSSYHNQIDRINLSGASRELLELKKAKIAMLKKMAGSDLKQEEIENINSKSQEMNDIQDEIHSELTLDEEAPIDEADWELEFKNSVEMIKLEREKESEKKSKVSISNKKEEDSNTKEVAMDINALLNLKVPSDTIKSRKITLLKK
jgi:hypothetical protein